MIIFLKLAFSNFCFWSTTFKEQLDNAVILVAYFGRIH